jgi:hypothetical protein
MIISAAVTAKPAPLDALVWVFGVVGGAAVVLALATMALAANHKKRRDAQRYQPALAALAGYLRDVESIEQIAGLQGGPAAEPRVPYQAPADSGRALTTGDLVMDPGLLRHVTEIATELKRLHRKSPPEPPRQAVLAPYTGP